MNTFTWKSIWRIRHTDEMRSILEVALNSYEKVCQDAKTVERLARVQTKWYDRTGFLSNPHIKKNTKKTCFGWESKALHYVTESRKSCV